MCATRSCVNKDTVQTTPGVASACSCDCLDKTGVGTCGCGGSGLINKRMPPPRAPVALCNAGPRLFYDTLTSVDALRSMMHPSDFGRSSHRVLGAWVQDRLWREAEPDALCTQVKPRFRTWTSFPVWRQFCCKGSNSQIPWRLLRSIHGSDWPSLRRCGGARCVWCCASFCTMLGLLRD